MFCFKSFALISKVLFEITLLREWKKTFSCSNTSKNAVRLYCYKEQFLSFCRVSPFGFPRCSDRDFSAESGAKISHIFWTTKSFWKNFSEFFQNLFSYRFEPYFLFEAGAKVSHFSESPKDFGTFFKIFQNLFLCFGVVFLSRSGCKDKDFSRQLPNNSGTFFRQFSRLFLTRLWISELVVKIF